MGIVRFCSMKSNDCCEIVMRWSRPFTLQLTFPHDFNALTGAGMSTKRCIDALFGLQG